MSTQDIVQKLWNLCNVLRDDGITYHQYVTELTYILFLKMADETGADKDIPEVYRWGSLTSRSGIDLKKHYYTLLSKLGEESVGRVAQIYANASSSIEEPKNLEKIITEIDKLDWYEAKEEGLGDLYEGLLEKNANEKKSGAGQYFTPRVLIGKTRQLRKSDFAEFVAGYEDPPKRTGERWSRFTREEIAKNPDDSLDLGLIRDDSIVDYDDLPDPVESGEEAIANLE